MDGLEFVDSASGVNDSGQTVTTDADLVVAEGDFLVCWVSWSYGGGTQSVVDNEAANAFTLKTRGGSEPYGKWGICAVATANGTARFTFDAGAWTARLRIAVFQFRPSAGYTITDHAGPSPATGFSPAGASGAIETTLPAVVLGALAMADVNTISNLQIDGVAADASVVYARGAVWYRDLTSADASVAATDSHQYNTNWLVDVLAIGVEASSTTYTVTYNGNGSTGGTVPTDASSPYEDQEIVTVLGNTGNLVRTGYAFTGWNTAANGSGTAYDPADTFEMPTENVVLYAQWAATYTLTYDDNDATSGTAPTDASSPYVAGASVTILGNTGSLVRTDYIFLGWNTAADGSGTTYMPSSSLSMPAANTTLYARWVEEPEAGVAAAGIALSGGLALSV